MREIINGYMALIGTNNKSGTFKYFEEKENAEIWAEITKRTLVGHIKGDLKIYIKPIKLHKCKIESCKDLIPLDEIYCLACSDLLFEAELNVRDDEI